MSQPITTRHPVVQAAIILMVLAAFTIPWHPAPKPLGDCVPASLQYLATYYHQGGQPPVLPRKEWVRLCKTTSDGTDPQVIEAAWEAGVPHTHLVCIYSSADNVADGHHFDPSNDIIYQGSFDRICTGYLDPRGPLIMGHLYLWLGMHRDLLHDGTFYGHAAVVWFTRDTITMVSPNSVAPNGLPYTEVFSYPELLSKTVAVYDIDPDEGLTPLSNPATIQIK